MKKAILTMVCLLASSGAFAQIPGGITTHKMNCSAATNDEGSPLLGVGYEMKCFTQALAPQYSLRGCELIRTVVYPGAKGEKIELAIKKQTVGNAKLEAADGSVQVRVHKNDLSAVVIFSNSAEMECSAAN